MPTQAMRRECVRVCAVGGRSGVRRRVMHGAAPSLPAANGPVSDCCASFHAHSHSTVFAVSAGDPRIVNAPAASSSYTPATIPCCECGALIQANPANTCVNCLKSKVDITDGITKQVRTTNSRMDRRDATAIACTLRRSARSRFRLPSPFLFPLNRVIPIDISSPLTS